jgi:hypothetical protein
VEVNPAQVTEVDVLEGVVEVTGVHQPGKSVVLKPGFSTRVSMQGDPEGPLPTEEIRPDLDRERENMNEEGDGFEHQGDLSGRPGSDSAIQQTAGGSTKEQSGQDGPDGPNR